MMDLDEVAEDLSSLANGNGMDPLTVKGDDLLIWGSFSVMLERQKSTIF
jgi:hypothetical protein